MFLGSYSISRPGAFELPVPAGGAGALEGSPLPPQPCGAWLGTCRVLCSDQGWCGGEPVCVCSYGHTEEPCQSFPGVCCAVVGERREGQSRWLLLVGFVGT